MIRKKELLERIKKLETQVRALRRNVDNANAQLYSGFLYSYHNQDSTDMIQVPIGLIARVEAIQEYLDVEIVETSPQPSKTIAKKKGKKK